MKKILCLLVGVGLAFGLKGKDFPFQVPERFQERKVKCGYASGMTEDYVISSNGDTLTYRMIPASGVPIYAEDYLPLAAAARHWSLVGSDMRNVTDVTIIYCWVLAGELEDGRSEGQAVFGMLLDFGLVLFCVIHMNGDTSGLWEMAMSALQAQEGSLEAYLTGEAERDEYWDGYLQKRTKK